MFTASNSSHGNTPRSGPAEHAPPPPFVVTSSNDTPFATAATPVKTTNTVALNPEAREFRLTPSFGGSLFAMPQQQQQQRWGLSDFSTFPTRPSGSPHSSSPPAQRPTAAVTAGVLDSARLVEFTEAYMHEIYDRKCREEQLHMVSVFHLHPRTTNKQLSNMFFPTGACAAEVLELRQLPEPLANAFNAVRQRAGAVFFSRKDFAMVGVEKINDFVPHGQHQPLAVRYCGPDTQRGSTPLSVPKMASPPSGRPTPPQVAFRDPQPHQRDVFPASAAAAVAVGPQTLPTSDRLSSGSTVDVVAAVAAGSASNTYELIDQHFLQKYAGEDVYLVGVHNLSYDTNARSFYKMFYPMGAVNSELLPRPVSVDGKRRCSGVAIFASKGMAMEAAEKMNDFVPHGQRRPVVARFLARTPAPVPSPLLNVAASTAAAPPAATDTTRDAQHGAPLATASTPRANPVSPPPSTTTASSAEVLLLAVDRQLHAKSVSDSQLAADMCALVLCNDSGEAEAKRLADLLRDTLQSMGDHSTILSSPISGAFRTMHSTLGIRLRTAPPSPADDTAAVKKGIMFLHLIGRAFMMLVADTAAPRQSRIVAAVQCAYLYQYTYLPKTPFCFATVLFQNCSTELKAAKAFLHREAGVPSSVEEERQHRPWITLMDALNEMVQVWKSLDPQQYAQDSARGDYERFVREFRGGAVVTDDAVNARSPVKAQLSHGEGGAEACTPRNDTLEVSVEGTNAASGSGSGCGFGLGSGNGASSSSAKKSQLVTPSARPTPRRVVSKSYSTSASDWKAKQGTPVNVASGAVPPQVMLSSSASEYTQGASELSVESSSANPFSSALRSVGLTPQHPSMRFAWGSLATGTTQPTPAPIVAAVPVPMVMSSFSPTTYTAAAAGTVPSSAMSASGAAERTDAAMTECTAYITKLPSCLNAAQVRRLLLHFGDFRKVRLCHDDKETSRCGTAEAVAAHQLKFHDLCFGFVEFVEPGSARAMVEFFRNEVHTPTAFDFLRTPGESQHDGFDEAELNLLRSTRTSQARNPIHDQQPVDATRTTPCFFGLIHPQHTVETYAEAVSSEDVAAAVKALEVVPQPQQPMQTTIAASTPFAPTSVFSTAAPFHVSAGARSDASVPASLSTAFTIAPVQPMEDVHFPQNFPYHHIFTGGCEDEPGNARSGGDDNDDGDDAPVLVEEDDEDGLQDYQVQQILQLLN
jgi:hypothetical protein